jgi:hypothetical protein
LQVLPHVVRGVYIWDNVDWGLRAAVAMAEWWLVTCRMPRIDDTTMEKIEQASKDLMEIMVKGWRQYQTSEWRLPKFHNIAHFSFFIRSVNCGDIPMFDNSMNGQLSFFPGSRK